jgi:hypothetical protein
MFLKTISETAERILAGIRDADTEEHQAEAERTADTKAARAREKKREGQKQLRVVKLQTREAALQVKNQVLAKLADERAVITDRLADLTGEIGKLTDRLGLVDRKLGAARTVVNRLALNPALPVTVRLTPTIDRLVPPREAELLDGAVWTALVVEGMRKGTSGAWAVDFTFDERSGQLVGEPKYHYDVTADERRTRLLEVEKQIAARRTALRHADPTGQFEREAASAALQAARR